MRLIYADELRGIYSSVPNGVYTTGHIITAIDECKTIDAIPVEPLSEWLAGYCAPPKYAIDAVGGLREMADATKRAKAWEFALTSMERSGFLEVRVE